MLTPCLASERAIRRIEAGSSLATVAPELMLQKRTGFPVLPCTNSSPRVRMKPPSPANFSFKRRRSIGEGLKVSSSGSKGKKPASARFSFWPG
jgi:hypothetical protein